MIPSLVFASAGLWQLLKMSEGNDKTVKATDLLSLLESLSMAKPYNSEKKVNQHEFWSTQPVPQSKNELFDVNEDGPIDLKAAEKIRHTPYELCEGYQFTEFDIESESVLNELYHLLCENYVEDYDSLFRFEYSKEFLIWALKAPGWKKEWHVAIRSVEDSKLMAFICAVPCKFKIRKHEIDSVEVNFLCIEKSLRSKRLAPLLIKEVTRRVNLEGIFQALYTAGIPLPEPVGTSQYYHRPLNFKKLLECGFTYLPPGKTVDQMEKYYKLPSKTAFNIRPLSEKDIPCVMKLFEQYMSRFQLSHFMNIEEFRHWFLPREKVIYSYVVFKEDEESEILDFFSFYSIPSSILNQPDIPHKTIEVAYLFYYSVSSEIRLLPLIKTALQEAFKLGFDVLNCLNLMENEDNLLNALKFGAGDGQLRFYLYNWKTKLLKPSEIGFIML